MSVNWVNFDQYLRKYWGGVLAYNEHVLSNCLASVNGLMQGLTNVKQLSKSWTPVEQILIIYWASIKKVLCRFRASSKQVLNT